MDTTERQKITTPNQIVQMLHQLLERTEALEKQVKELTGKK